MMTLDIGGTDAAGESDALTDRSPKCRLQFLEARERVGLSLGRSNPIRWRPLCITRPSRVPLMTRWVADVVSFKPATR